MKPLIRFVLLFALIALDDGAQNLAAQGGKGGGKCENVPIRVTLLPLSGGLTSVLSGDGSDSYQDGVQGVSARINLCSGSNDATITSGQTRKIGITFPPPVAGSSLSGITPVWVPGKIQVSFFFNIRNILCEQGTCGDTFTTRMNWQFQEPDRKGYRLRFYPHDANAPDLHSPDMLTNEPDINLPYETSPWLCITSRETAPTRARIRSSTINGRWSQPLPIRTGSCSSEPFTSRVRGLTIRTFTWVNTRCPTVCRWKRFVVSEAPLVPKSQPSPMRIKASRDSGQDWAEP